MKNKFYLLILFLILLLFTTFSLEASCNLAGCPSGLRTEGVQRRHIVDQTIGYITFDINHHNGNYLQYEPRYEFRGINRVVVGGFASLIALDDGHDSHSGLGNPVLFGEVVVKNSTDDQLSFGSQLELALGDDENGLAAEHMEIVPYLSYSNSAGSIDWMGSTGYRHSLESGDRHESAIHSELFVNPHADKEYLYRLHARFPKIRGSMSPDFVLDGQHALDGEDDGKGFLSIGAGLSFSAGTGWTFSPKVEIPVTTPRRFDSKLSFNGSMYF